jgi:hypothetical protein
MVNVEVAFVGIPRRPEPGVNAAPKFLRRRRDSDFQPHFNGPFSRRACLSCSTNR